MRKSLIERGSILGQGQQKEPDLMDRIVQQSVPNQTTGSSVVDTTELPVTETTGSSVTDPLRAALLTALAAPFPVVEKPKYNVTSIKIRSDLPARIQLAMQLTGKQQQEIVAAALERYLPALAAEIAAEEGKQ